MWAGSICREKTTYLIEMHVIPEMGIPVQLWVSTIHSPATILVSGEDVNESMLDLFGASSEIHVLMSGLASLYESGENSAASGSLNIHTGEGRKRKKDSHRQSQLGILPGGNRRNIGGIAEDYNISLCQLPTTQRGAYVDGRVSSPFNQQEIDGTPDRTSPVGVTAKLS